LRSHNVPHTCFKSGDQVELAFADNGGVGFDEGALRFVQPVEDAALSEEKRFRRIQIFGRLGA
jgi:hypothetical protein